MTSNTIVDPEHRRKHEPPDISGHRPGRLSENIVIGYSNQIDEIIANLGKQEEELQLRPTESELQSISFNQLLDEYSRHEKYITELSEYCHTIIRSKEEGQELRDNDSLSQEDRDEVGLKLDEMIVLYDKLKILATDRLHTLQLHINARQDAQIERFEKWLTGMESRILNSNIIGPDHETISRQLNDIRQLRHELEQKQTLVDTISRTIIFDNVDSDFFQLQISTSSSLDEQLDAINSRWTTICHFVDDRYEKLKKAHSIWKVLSIEGPQLFAWLNGVEARLNELSSATQNAGSSDVDPAFITTLINRSNKIEQSIKSKQSFYTSLENRVRNEIEHFDDPCSMLVIELEKRLEDMQDMWNSIMRRKRMIDFSLQGLSDPDSVCQHEPQYKAMSPMPDPINVISSKDSDSLGESANIHSGLVDNYDDLLTTSSSNNIEDKESSLQFNGSLSDPSTMFDNTYPTPDMQSSSNNNNSGGLKYNDQIYRDEISSATDLTSPTTTGPVDVFTTGLRDDSIYCYPQHVGMASFNANQNNVNHLDHGHAEGHHCRVEEWKHSLESFTIWLRHVEIQLEIEGAQFDPILETNKQSSLQMTWSKLELQEQIKLFRDITQRIKTTCQYEFDDLCSRYQQIIEDLMPEIGENEYEANPKEIPNGIEIRYGSVKSCLQDRKKEIWRKLSKKLIESCNHIINQMSEVVPETEIGVDLITLAHQQDQLLHLKDDVEQSSIIQSSLEDAKVFLELCDTEFTQSTEREGKSVEGVTNTWMSFSDCKENIEEQLDKLQLHRSELLQLIQDRLDRLNNIHKEMHALQQSIQDLATNLQLVEILRLNWVPVEDLSIEELSEQLDDLKLYRERLCEVEDAHKMTNSIIDWMESFSAPLSQSNLKRIEELNGIWTSIQESVDERQKQIERAFDERSGSEQQFLAQTVADLPGRWERKVATSKVPYFVDHVNNKTLWDHPKFTDLLDSLNKCKQYVYSVYRTAMKVRLVQKRLGIDKLMLEHLEEIFILADQQLKQQAVSKPSSSLAQLKQQNDASIGVEQVIILLKAIFTKIEMNEGTKLDIPLAVDLTLNWLSNLYDSSRTGHLSALSVKIGLVLMCCATREEKYLYMFRLVSDFSDVIDARKLGSLIEICMRIPVYLGEEETFGAPSLIEESVRGCLSSSKFLPQHPNCIDKNDYLSWLKTEPQFIIWLPVLHRILISENTIHRVKCRLCHTDQIKGLRYRCLKCFRFNICQQCFLAGRNISEHSDPNTHQMQEYCYRTSTGEKVRDFTKILRNKVNPRASPNQ